MTESDAIEIITRFEHAFRGGDQATTDELCDPGLVDHNPAPGHEPTLAGFKPRTCARSSRTSKRTCRTLSPTATASPPDGS